MSHVVMQRLLTLHAETWSKYGTTKVVEQVHFSHIDPPVLKEMYLDPMNENLMISEVVYHMKIEPLDKYHDIVWFWS